MCCMSGSNGTAHHSCNGPLPTFCTLGANANWMHQLRSNPPTLERQHLEVGENWEQLSELRFVACWVLGQVAQLVRWQLWSAGLIAPESGRMSPPVLGAVHAQPVVDCFACPELGVGTLGKTLHRGGVASLVRVSVCVS